MTKVVLLSSWLLLLLLLFVVVVVVVVVVVLLISINSYPVPAVVSACFSSFFRFCYGYIPSHCTLSPLKLRALELNTAVRLLHSFNA